jgi:hypothetical protein
VTRWARSTSPTGPARAILGFEPASCGLPRRQGGNGRARLLI